MNKKFLILPVVSALLLAGCTMGRTTKKKKKSSSVDVTSQSVAPSPTSGTPAPTPTSATPAPAPTSATPAPTPTSQTSQVPTPTGSTSVVPPTPGEDWTEAQKTAMVENIGFVPEYMAGLDAAEYDSENYEYWCVVENDIHASYEAILLAKGWTASDDNPFSGTFEDSTPYTGYEYTKDSGTVDPESGKQVFFVSQMLVYDDEGTVTQFDWYSAVDDEGGGGDEPPAGSWTQVTTTPAAGTDYIIGLNNGTSDVFLDGSMQNTYYPGCEATTDTAIRFTVALSGEGFTIQATSGSVSGKYLGITISGTHVNAVYGDSAYVWKWVDTDTYQGSTVEAHTFGAYEDGGYGSQWYILAQQSGKTTVSPTYNKWWSSNFIARLYKQAA